MPSFKSQAQKEKFVELLKAGQITQEVYDAYDRGTGNAALPERITPKTQPTSKKPVGKKK